MVLYIVLDFGSWTTFVQVFKVEVFDDERFPKRYITVGSRTSGSVNLVGLVWWWVVVEVVIIQQAKSKSLD